MDKLLNHIFRVILVVTAMGPLSSFAANDAAKLLDQSAAKIKSAKSISASYTLQSGGNSIKGTLLLSGDKFTTANNAMTTWYDGKTQWTYAPSTAEFNIIEPTDEELAASNPLAIISGLKNRYTASIIKSAPGYRTILLKAISKANEWPQITVTLKSSTLLPSAISIKGNDGSITNIAIPSIQIRNTPVSDSAFRFDRKKYPKAKIVDLR